MKYSISHVANYLLMAGPFSLNCNTCMKDYSNDDNVV